MLALNWLTGFRGNVLKSSLLKPVTQDKKHVIVGP
jgi:hypothetical protein